MKKAILIISILANCINFAYANYNHKTDFEFYHDGYLVEASGKFYLEEVPIKKQKDVYQRSNFTPIDVFRNTFTAYQQKNIGWLIQHTKGEELEKKQHIKENLEYFSFGLYNMQGFVIFRNFAIVLLKETKSKEKIIFALEYNNEGELFISTNFKQLHPIQYTVIEQAYKGNGEFKIVKNK